MERRQKSAASLASFMPKVPDLSELPVASPEGLSLRSTEEVVHRAIAIYLTSTYADVLLQQNCPRDDAFAFANKFIQRYQAESLFSPQEKAFLESPSPAISQIGQFCWGWEILHFLLWALGFVDDIGVPKDPVAVPKCSRVFTRNRIQANLIAAAKLRTAEEVLDLLDVAQCCEFANREREVFSTGPVHGWMRAAKWLTSRADWDNVK
jgi:hypothetical protein